jgi:heme exporter protein A
MFRGHHLACQRGERLVFRDLDFAVAPGGALILRGPNGAGKSTLLRVMASLLPPLAGHLSWNDRPIESDTHRAHLRYVGHLDGLKPLLTPKEDLEFWARFEGESRQAADRALERFGLSALAESPIRFLSAGQRRRVALARLLLSNRALWLLDEPTLALDDAASAILSDAIAEHRSHEGMVVVATHGDLAVPDAATMELRPHAARDGSMVER